MTINMSMSDRSDHLKLVELCLETAIFEEGHCLRERTVDVDDLRLGISVIFGQ